MHLLTNIFINKGQEYRETKMRFYLKVQILHIIFTEKPPILKYYYKNH